MEPTTAAGIQDQFLNLLTTQLRHQDPLEPTKQEDFIAQLAQFSTLEGIEKLNDNFSEFMASQVEGQGTANTLQAEALKFQNLASAANLVGSEVSFTVFDEDGASDQKNKGVVDSVVLKDDAVHLRIGDDLVRMEHIQEIGSESQSLSDLVSLSDLAQNIAPEIIP